MAEMVPPDKRRRPWGWWLAASLALLVLLTVVLLVYPSMRQQHLITQLTARGFTFQRIGVPGRSWRDWINWRWVPVRWRSTGLQEINIYNPDGRYDPANTPLLKALVSLDHEGFHSPARCWYDFTLLNATDQELAQIPKPIRLIRFTGVGPTLTDDGIAHLQSAIYLRRLSLNAPLIGDRSLAHFAGCTYLRYLLLNGRQITDTGLVHLKGLTRLGTLSLPGSQITGSGLIHLAGLPELQHLNLSHSRITDANLIHLSKLSRLTSVDLSHTQVTEAGLIDLRWLPPKLRQVILSRKQVSPACARKLETANIWVVCKDKE